MNLGMLIISLLIFVVVSRLSYEVWFLPHKYKHRIEDQRKFLKILLGFSYWKEDRVNFTIVKFACIFLLILSIIGIVISITGPINY